MQANDLPELERRLAELADAFGGRPPGKGALRVWLDALKECRFDDVQSALTDWPKAYTKMPVPAEVLKVCRSETSRRLEEQARINAATAGTVEAVLEKAEPTANAIAFKRMWAAWRSGKVESPRQWCINVLASDRADEHLKRFAEQSLEQMEPEADERAKRASVRWDMKEAA